MKAPLSADVTGSHRRPGARLPDQRPIDKPNADEQISAADAQRLLHQLQVQHLEMEMQNTELRSAHAQAQATTEKYSDFYEFAPVGYVSLDNNGLIQELNLTAARHLGGARVALVGKPFMSSVVRPDRDAFVRQLKAAYETKEKTDIEVHLAGEENHATPVRLSVICIQQLTAPLRQYRISITDISVLKKAEDEIHRLQAELEGRVVERAKSIQTIAADLILTEQQERSRVARVLHDQLQQVLVGSRYIMAGASDGCSEAGQKAFAQVDQMLSQCIETARSLSTELSPPILREEGLAAALEWLSNWMLEKHGLTVKLFVGPKSPLIPKELSLLLYQSARELLLNVVKHAGVNCARVDVRQKDGELTIDVSDKGKGFDAAHFQSVKVSSVKNGLYSVRERIELMGGCMDAESTPGRGSRFTLRMPLRLLATHRPQGERP